MYSHCVLNSLRHILFTLYQGFYPLNIRRISSGYNMTHRPARTWHKIQKTISFCDHENLNIVYISCSDNLFCNDLFLWCKFGSVANSFNGNKWRRYVCKLTKIKGTKGDRMISKPNKNLMHILYEREILKFTSIDFGTLVNTGLILIHKNKRSSVNYRSKTNLIYFTWKSACFILLFETEGNLKQWDLASYKLCICLDFLSQQFCYSLFSTIFSAWSITFNKYP